jgi:hypothetical protein
MMSVSTIRRSVAVLLLAGGLLAAGCRKTDAQPNQKADLKINPPGDDSAAGSTYLRADGLEELNIAPRAAGPAFGAGVGPIEEDDDYPVERRPAGIGSSVIKPDGKEELIIPLRERYFEDEPVMPRVVGK